MTPRLATALAAALVAACLCAWLLLAPPPAPDRPPEPAPVASGAPQPADEDDAALPVPPVPPRIAEGADYEKCLAMLASDPDGAYAFAEAWEATGGGDGATHCRALAQVALGNPADGAAELDKLSTASKAPPLARAQVLGQAVQAWLMADDADRAFQSATAALALSPDDPDLLIDRSVAAGTTGRYLDAIDDLTRALGIDPHRSDALVLRASAWRHEDKLGSAHDDIDRALAVNPEDPEAYLERGILRQRLGDTAGARADWEEAIRLSPDTATADLAQQNLALLEAGPARR